MDNLSLPPRVQFIAVRSHILELIEKGYSLSYVYKEFVEQKKIKMSYSTFVRYALGRDQRAKSGANTKASIKCKDKSITTSENQPFGKKDTNPSDNI